MAAFRIAALEAGGGELGLSPLPGQGGAYGRDLETLLAWKPGLVLSLTQAAEMATAGAAGLGDDLVAAGVTWWHLPIVDFSVPAPPVRFAWAAGAPGVAELLGRGGRVLIHCRGGCGRSGMMALRLLVDMGEAPYPALARLRAARPCAVETAAQHDWAIESWEED